MFDYWKHLEEKKRKRADNRKKINCFCANCGQKFHAKITLNQKYCSEKCFKEARYKAYKKHMKTEKYRVSHLRAVKAYNLRQKCLKNTI